MTGPRIRLRFRLGDLQQGFERGRVVSSAPMTRCRRTGHWRCGTSAPLGNAMKFAVPATDNGRVYVGTRDGSALRVRPADDGVAVPVHPPTSGRSPVGRPRPETVTVTAITPREVTVTGVNATRRRVRSRSRPSFSRLPLLWPPVKPSACRSLSLPPTATWMLPAPCRLRPVPGTPGLRPARVRHQGRPCFATPQASLAFGDVPTKGEWSPSAPASPTPARRPRRSPSVTPCRRHPSRVASPPAVGSTLAPGSSVSLYRSPSRRPPPARVASRLVVSSSTGNVTVPLSGTGVAGSSQLTVTPTVVDFGTVPLGQTVTKAFDISNTGNLVLTLTKAAPAAATLPRGQPRRGGPAALRRTTRFARR